MDAQGMASDIAYHARDPLGRDPPISGQDDPVDPSNSGLDPSISRGQKRRPSDIDDQEDNSMESFSSGKIHHQKTFTSSLKTEDLIMDDCAAAMVLMSLSCSPKSPHMFQANTRGNNARNETSSKMFSFESASHDSGVSSSLSSCYSRNSPPSSSFKLSLPDEPDATQMHRTGHSSLVSSKHLSPQQQRNKRKQIVYQCTWPGCDMKYRQNSAIEAHVRTVHLGPGEVEENEEEFYYTEMEVSEQEALLDESSGSEGSSSPGPVGAEAPTWSHLDMARPPTEDPEYLEQLRQRQQPMVVHLSSPINIPFLASSNHILHRNKVMRVESKSLLASPASSLSSSSSSKRRGRGETRKCRKVYGMEARDLWCTQCKWKKACTRFTD